MTIRKYTAHEFSCGAVQVWSKAQYKIEMGRVGGQGHYYVRVFQGRTNEIDMVTPRVSEAQREFKRLVQHWEQESTIRTITERLEHGPCPSPEYLHTHRFELDTMDNAIVCIHCGLVKGQV